MLCKIKNSIPGRQLKIAAFVCFFLMQLPVQNLFAQVEKVATLQLSFIKTDSTKTCKATVLSDTLHVKGVEVHLYVKRWYSLLPVGKVVTTDDRGEADIDFPNDLPGDNNGMLTVIAKIEKDAIYGNVETQSAIKWGVSPKAEPGHLSSRSLSASRENAPMFLVIASTLIIAVIWGVIFYVVFQLVSIRRSARLIKKISMAEN